MELSLLRKVTFNTDVPSLKINFAERFISLARELNEIEEVADGYIALGHGLIRSGRIPEGVQKFFYVLTIADSIGNEKLKGLTYLNLANAYDANEDYESAKNSQFKAIEIFEEIGQDDLLAPTYVNLGFNYINIGEFDSALFFLQKALEEDQSQHYELHLPYILGNAALAYGNLERIDTAEYLLSKAFESWFDFEEHYAIADCQIQFGGICIKQGQFVKGLDYLRSGYNRARTYGLKEQIQDGAQMLSELYEQRGDFPNALKYQKEYYTYRDSLINAESIRKIADERTAYEVGLKQAELDVANAQKQTQQYLILAIAAFAILILIVAVIVYRNFLDKKRVNLQLEVQKRILEDQKQSLEELNNTKDRFFSIISHDLRGPVQAFHGVSRIIKFLVKQKQTEQLEELAEHIDESADRLSALLDNLLSWAVQQQGQITYIPEKLDMSEICNDLAMTFKNMADGKGIEIHHVAPKDIYSWSDRNTTMTIFRNILNNALKFTPEGGEVFFEVKSEGSSVVTVIRDTGVGIPKDKIPDLFKMKAKKSTWGTDNEKGLGLGLQLVKEFVDMNKGDISVSSEEGKGTSFTISLPSYQEEVLAAKN